MREAEVRALAPLACAAAGLVLITACSGTPKPPAVADPGPTLSEAELSRLHNEGLEPSALLNDDLSAPWSVAAGGQTGKSIDIVYDIGNCNRHLGAQVTEGPGSVEIAIVFKQVEGDCAGVGLPVMATVRLDTPLGTRTLLHAPTSPAFGGQQVYQ